MNIHITYALLAVFATILIAPAYGQGASPITVSTDSDTYDHESKIFVTGSVETIRSGNPSHTKLQVLVRLIHRCDCMVRNIQHQMCQHYLHS